MTEIGGLEATRRLAERWRLGFAVTAGLCLLALAINMLFFELRPASVWGLIYGGAAALLLLGVALYGVRRRLMSLASRRRAGRARSWLHFHVYAGLLFALLVLMHSGFRYPSGWITLALWWLSLWSAASGLLGLGLQRWLPHMLTSGLSTEVLYERIPELIGELRLRAQTLASASGEGVMALHDRRVAPALERPRRRWIYLLDITGGIKAWLKEFQYLESFLDDAERARLEELEEIYRTKLEIDAHYTLQQVLRGWLWLHVPVSLLLLAFLAVHVTVVLLY